MATYKSRFKGSQIDNAVSVANANLNRGDSETPIYYDSEGLAQPIEKDTVPTVSSVKPLTSGGAYTGLNAVVDYSDIQTSTSLGTSGMPPSQGATKQYIDTTAASKQDTLYGGYGIDVNGATVSVSDDVFREDEEARLHADLKVDHFGDISVGNDSEVLELMNEAKHSSFDKSKFTIVGSPIITSDGIASGLDTSNYLYITPEQKSYSNFIINFNYVYSASGSINGYTTIGNFYQIYNNGVGASELKLITSENGNVVVKSITVTGMTQTVGVEYNVKIIINNLNVRYSVTNLSTGVEVHNDITLNEAFTIGSSFPKALVLYNIQSADYKKAYIIADGVPVFSGNKTGIDTIKPDDYTVVGTPTISADGIASGFSDSNYLTYSKEVTTFSTIEFYSPIIRVTGALGGYLFNGDSITNGIRFGVSSSGTSLFIYAWWLGGGTGEYKQWGYSGVSVGNSYQFKYIVNGTSVSCYASVNGGAYSQVGETVTIPNTVVNYNISGRIGNVGVAGYYAQGCTLDLNGYKISVDGDLVYQPCLKIPYTLTKDGKKIVDYNYKSRVEDEYTQAGFTPYYTLQQELGDNYTVVGSPTISADGIASGFSGSDYINLGTYVPINKTFEIQMKTAVTSEMTQTGVENRYLGVSGGTRTVSGALYTQDGLLAAWFKLYDTSSSSNRDITVASFNQEALKVTNLSVGDIIEIRLGRNKEEGKYYVKYRKNEVGNFIEASANYSFDLTTSSAVFILGALQPNLVKPWLGSIDLKSFKIYVDNELVYTATPNYTVATVEASDIVDEYLNGATSYTQRANLQLEQQGTTTSGTTVTFPKAFIDTNYALSIPYSAKTKTGFTAAADGDYIAEGYTSL